MKQTHKNTIAQRGNKNAEKEPDEKATTVITLRVRAKDKYKWQELANQAGISMSQYIIDRANGR